MKKLKFTLLVGICALAFNVSAQEVGVNITEIPLTLVFTT